MILLITIIIGFYLGVYMSDIYGVKFNAITNPFIYLFNKIKQLMDLNKTSTSTKE